MASISKLKIDQEASHEGIWVSVVDDIRFKIARWMNPRHAEAFSSLTRPHRQEILRGTLPKKDEDRLMAIAMARGLLNGWENLQDDDGNDIPFNIQNAEKLLRDPEMEWVVEFIKEQSQDQESYRIQAMEEASGN